MGVVPDLLCLDLIEQVVVDECDLFDLTLKHQQLIPEKHILLAQFAIIDQVTVDLGLKLEIFSGAVDDWSP